MRPYDTKFHRVEELYFNASVGGTSDCVYVDLDRGECWDLLQWLLGFLQYSEDPKYTLTLPCKLTPCGLYGSATEDI